MSQKINLGHCPSLPNSVLLMTYINQAEVKRTHSPVTSPVHSTHDEPLGSYRDHHPRDLRGLARVLVQAHMRAGEPVQEFPVDVVGKFGNAADHQVAPRVLGIRYADRNMRVVPEIADLEGLRRAAYPDHAVMDHHSQRHH